MRKKFVEPSMKRIELNLNENIATSSGKITDEFGFRCWYHFTECTVQNSGKTFLQGLEPEELTACYVSNSNQNMRGGMIVSEDVARMYMRY